MGKMFGEIGTRDTYAHPHVLDAPADGSFERITRLASTVVQTPIALISLINPGRPWITSGKGLSAADIGSASPFCAHVIQGNAVMVVPDALDDPRFNTAPSVIGGPKLRFYLGVPLRMYDGQIIGTLCAMDTAPRQPSAAQIAMIADLARMVVNEMELRQLALTDSLTGALTRRGLEQRLETEQARGQRNDHAITLLALDLDHFKSVNDRFGHAAGDVLLRRVVEVCRGNLRGGDVIGRIGGEEFVIMLPEMAGRRAVQVAERLRLAVQGIAIAHGAETLRVTASVGVAMLAPDDRTVQQALHRADMALYAAKEHGRNCVRLDAALSWAELS